MRKKVDERIRTMVENGVKGKHRSLFVIIGDKGRDQVRASTKIFTAICCVYSMKSRMISPRIAGCQSSLYAHKGNCEGTSVCAMVLQERAFP